MKMGGFSYVSLCTTLVLFCGFIELGDCRQGDDMATMKLGGVHDYRGSQNSGEIESIARFAVQEHNKRENSLLEFVKVLKAKEQVVAGTMYHLTLEARSSGKMNIYEARIWVKPWMNFKQLEEFKPAEAGHSF